MKKNNTVTAGHFWHVKKNTVTTCDFATLKKKHCNYMSKVLQKKNNSVIACPGE